MGLFRNLMTESIDNDSVSDTIVSYFGRKMGYDFKFVSVSSYNDGDLFKGRLYISDDGPAIRVNWKLSKFDGISIWRTFGDDINKPSYDLKYSDFSIDNDSLVKILPKFLEAMKYNRISEEVDSIIKVKGKESIEIPNEKLKNEEKKLKGEEFSDINTVYDDISVQVKSVAKGYNAALLICGKQGGTGKSYTVNKALKEAGSWPIVDYTTIKGGVTAVALYKDLYEYYDRVIVFDDCDSVLIGGTDSTNMLKAALDTGNHRIVSWENSDSFNTTNMSHEEIEAKWSLPENKNKHPSSFEFSGGVIFISNLSKEFIGKKDSALLTRCLYVNVNIKPADMIERMRAVLPSVKVYAARKLNGEPQDVTNEELLYKVFDFLSSSEFVDNPKNKGKSISFRILNQIYLLALSGANDETWHRLAYSYMS